MSEKNEGQGGANPAEKPAAAPTLTAPVAPPKTVKLVAPKGTCSVGVDIGGQWIEVAIPKNRIVDVDRELAAELVAKHGFEAQ